MEELIDHVSNILDHSKVERGYYAVCDLFYTCNRLYQLIDDVNELSLSHQLYRPSSNSSAFIIDKIIQNLKLPLTSEQKNVLRNSIRACTKYANLILLECRDDDHFYNDLDEFLLKHGHKNVEYLSLVIPPEARDLTTSLLSIMWKMQNAFNIKSNLSDDLNNDDENFYVYNEHKDNLIVEKDITTDTIKSPVVSVSKLENADLFDRIETSSSSDTLSKSDSTSSDDEKTEKSKKHTSKQEETQTYDSDGINTKLLKKLKERYPKKINK